MKVVLTKDVKHVGRIGDEVSVAEGFARNFLFPQQLALALSDHNIKQYESLRKRAEKLREKRKTGAQDLIKKLDGQIITIEAKANEQKLYGAIHLLDIVEAIRNQLEVELEKRDVQLLDPIKEIGEFSIPIRLYEGIQCKVQLIIRDPEAVAAKKEKEAAEPKKPRAKKKAD